MASANDWISFLQGLSIQRTLVGQNSIYLPTELKMEILESLPGVDIARVSCVCSEFRNLASDNDLWKQKCLEEFPGFVTEEAEELIAVDLVVDWKDKFVEYWRRNKQKEGTSVRRSVVSCKPYRDRGFTRARDWDRGSGSTPISVRSLSLS